MNSTPDDDVTGTDDASTESGDADDGYVHDPGAFDEEGDPSDEPRHPDAAEREFDWRGWTLVATLLLAFVIAPLTVYVRPPALPYWVALIVMPLIPALVLGAVAVWATTRP